MDKEHEQLYISNIKDAININKEEFNRIITVCQDSIEDNVPEDIYSYYKMSDGDDSYGGDCSYNLFRLASDELVQSLEDGDTILIHCHMGQSRSVTVSIAALSVYEDIDYHESRGMVKDNASPIYPNDLLIEHCKRYIKENR